jgi:hypothetical protein
VCGDEHFLYRGALIEIHTAQSGCFFGGGPGLVFGHFRRATSNPGYTGLGALRFTIYTLHLQKGERRLGSLSTRLVCTERLGIAQVRDG